MQIAGVSIALTVAVAGASSLALYAAAESPLKFDWIDRTVDLTQDFYTFANGKWLNTTVIPADETSVSSFTEVSKLGQSILKEQLEEAERDTSSRLGSYYHSGVDMDARNKAGVKPLKPAFALVDKIKCPESLARTLAELQKQYASSAFFSFGISADLKDSNRNAPYLSSGGFGLPARNYYLDANKEPIRKAYASFIESSFKLANVISSDKNISQGILKFETFLANNTIDQSTVDNNDLYNPFTLDKVRTELCSKFQWKTYLDTLGFRQPVSTTVIVDTPDFFKAVCAFFDVQKKENLSLIKSYLKWTLLIDNQRYLSQELFDNRFAFFGKVLSGQQAAPALWRNVFRAVSTDIPDLLSQKYVAKAFPPQAKVNALTMVNLIRDSFCSRLGNKVAWLESETRTKAVEKCQAISIKIGYPDKWETYDGLKISRGKTFLENHLAAHEWAYVKNIKEFGKPVDRTLWGMAPFTVNAYYNPQGNEIVFPAAILQPPFFYQSPEGSAVDPFTIPANFGSIGAVIGHEITHAFDDSGSQFDATGNLADWWTAKDKEAFKARGQVIIDLFNSFTIFGEHVNGELTQGENIADLGGVKATFDAFQTWMQANGRVPDAQGFSAEQQFFLAYAQSWATLKRKESVLQQLASDPHSPAIFRVNGPLPNVQAFIDAFNVPAGAPMNKPVESRVDIW